LLRGLRKIQGGAKEILTELLNPAAALRFMAGGKEGSIRPSGSR